MKPVAILESHITAKEATEIFEKLEENLEKERKERILSTILNCTAS